MILPKLFRFVQLIVNAYGIDGSHDITHAMDVMALTVRIMMECDECVEMTKEERRMAIIAALLHDTVDKKYMDEKEGVLRVRKILKDDLTEKQINVICEIISTMSYSKIMAKRRQAQKKGETITGFPTDKQEAWMRIYHVVRQADLLSAYRVQRCVLYNQTKYVGETWEETKERVRQVFTDRILRHRDDGLLIWKWTEQKGKELEERAKEEIERL